MLVADSVSDGRGASIYGTVLHDGGTYRMWYQAWPKVWNGGDVCFVGYAESDDGEVWQKPALGLTEMGGSKENNLTNLGFHAPSVFIDPSADDAQRYRAVGCAMPHRMGSFQNIVGNGYYLAHSSDGLHWELDSNWPAWDGLDVVNSVYHPGRGCGQVALKRIARYRSIPRRAIWEAEVIDGQPVPFRPALIPDDFDDVTATTLGFASGDYYGMAMLPAARGTVGFLWNFRHWLPRDQTGIYKTKEMGGWGSTGISLTYQSGPGALWQHAPGRKDFIPHNARPDAEGGFYSASCPVEVGDEHRLYLSIPKRSHGRHTPNDEDFCSISYATWPKWRLFGFRADPDGIVTLHLGKLPKPVTLHLNYETEPGGSIRAELCNDRYQPMDEARTLEKAVVLKGSAFAAPVAWKDGTTIPAFEGETLIRLHLDRATAWAYETVGEKEIKAR